MLLNDLFEAQDEDFDSFVAALMSGPAAVVPKPKKKYSPLSPGSKRVMQVRVEELQEKYQELKQYHKQLRQFMTEMPPGLEQDLLELEKEYEAAIEVERAALEDSLNQTKIYKLLNGIRSKCSYAVKAMQSANTVLYRGTSYNQDVYIGKPHEARRVMTSSQKIQELYDNSIAKEGFKALRSNSIFTSGSKDLASGFGTHIYVIFPINGFDFTWSNTIRDIVISTDNVKSWIDRDRAVQLWEQVFMNEEAKNRFLELVGYGSNYSDGDPDDDNIPYTYKKNYILEYDGFLGNSLLAINLKALKTMESEGLLQGVPNELTELVSPKKVVSEMGLSHEHFTDALNSGHEICIRGAYYAISHKHLHLIKDVLKIY